MQTSKRGFWRKRKNILFSIAHKLAFWARKYTNCKILKNKQTILFNAVRLLDLDILIVYNSSRNIGM